MTITRPNIRENKPGERSMPEVLFKGVCVVVQFYPWFKFYFLLFFGIVMYDNNMIMSLKQKKRKFEPRIKLNHNICTGAVFMCWVEDISRAGCCTRFINYAVQVTRKYLSFSQNGTFGTKVPYLVVWCHKF